MSATPTTAPACATATGAPPTLAAPERPHFYAGQLLSNVDLSAIVDWSRDLRGLDRSVLGWGVVCGLPVSVDPANPSGLVIGPGYAIGAWGDDLVLGADTRLDLSTQCAARAANCAKPATNGSGAPAVFGIAAADVTTLDVLLMPSATRADPRRTAGISLDLPGDKSLHYARVIDGATPCVAPPAADPPDPATAFGNKLAAWSAAATAFLSAVQAASDTLQAAIASSQAAEADAKAAEADAKAKDDKATTTHDAADITAAADADKAAKDKRSQAGSKARDLTDAKSKAKANIQAAYAAWIKAYPAVRRPFVAAAGSSPTDTSLTNPTDATLTNPAALAALTFVVVDDGRASALAPACPACADAGPGVPLARVWIGRTINAQTAQRTCVVLAVDDAPPRRHPLAKPEPWPAPAGSVNLAPWLGRPVEAADGAALKAALARLGFSNVAVGANAPDFNRLKALVAAAPQLIARPGPGAALDIQLVDSGAFGAAPLGLRVAGIIAS